MCIRDLVRDRPTLDQFRVLMRADVMFKHLTGPLMPLGRYYAGPLTEEQIAILRS